MELTAALSDYRSLQRLYQFDINAYRSGHILINRKYSNGFIRLGDSATDVADSVSGIGNAASDTAKKIKGSLSGWMN